MCGIAGIVDHGGRQPIRVEDIQAMIAAISHRGPDGTGIWTGGSAGLGHARLSIIDQSGGAQPIGNEDGSIQVVLNGEIFNYIELRERLIARGHRFKTQSDTEVLVHLYEDYGDAMVGHLNGQFAFAIWDVPRAKLLLARDRVGIRPLFYTQAAGQLAFASEIKSLLTLMDCFMALIRSGTPKVN
jgi:asparagine synthase (glutamine-hydrolysing)